MKRILSVLLILAFIMNHCQLVVLADEEIQKNLNSVNTTELLMNDNKESSFIIKYKENSTSLTQSENLFSVNSNNKINDSNYEVIDFDTEKTIEEVKDELDNSNIEYIQPNYMLELASIDYSTYETNNIISKVNTVATGTSVVVGLVDSEIDIDNTDIKDCITEKRYSSVNNSDLLDAELKLEQTHATHLAGIIAGKSNVSGAYCANVSIMPLTVFKGNLARTSDIIEAINFAKSNGVDIINMSFGCSEDNAILKEAIENASDILFVAAAGNFRRNIDEKPIYPASYDLPNVLSVTSVNNDGGLSYFSDYGKNSVDVAAYGKDIESSLPGNKKGELSGTSISAAVVTRGAAVLYSNNKCNSPIDCISLINNTSDKISSLAGYVNNSSKFNLENALNNVIKSDIENIEYDDEFSISPEVYDESTSYKLFAMSKTIKVSAGTCHTLALKEDGTVWAWGDNRFGQLGNGTYKSSTYPVRVKGITNADYIDAGGFHSTAHTKDVNTNSGKSYIWGRGIEGQLGVGQTNRNTPVQSGNSNYKLASFHTVYSIGNHVYGMGKNSYGQLGEYNLGACIYSPNLFERDEKYEQCDVRTLATSDKMTLFITDQPDGEFPRNDDVLWGCGEGINDRVKLMGTYEYGKYRNIAAGYYNAIIYKVPLWKGYGDNTYKQRNGDFSNYDFVDCGMYFTLGLKSDGTVYNNGLTFYNQEYLENGENIVTGTTKINLSNIVDMSAGSNFAVFVDKSGNIWGLGDNSYGQLGTGTTDSAYEPVKVNERKENNDDTAVKTANGTDHYLALKSDGTVWAWGNNDYGQIGNGTNISPGEPVKVNNLSNITDIKAGDGFSLALKSDGTVWAWGKNNYGQLGNGKNVNSSVPVQVQIDSEVKAISAGYEHSLLVTKEKLAYGWGRNNCHQLCDGTQTDKSIPTLIPKLTYLSNVSAGYNHSVLLKQDGTVYTCGSNDNLQLGRSDDLYKVASVMTNAKGIAAGKGSTFILNENGILYACGNNENKKLGIDGDNKISTFTAIPGLTDVEDIQTKDSLNIAKTTTGEYFIWGWGTAEAPFYCYEPYINNEYINTIDISNISNGSVGIDNVFIIKNNRVYCIGNMSGDAYVIGGLDGYFFAPLAWDYRGCLPPENGKGTEDSPYLIKSIDDFYKIANAESSYYRLDTNLDFGGDSIHPIYSFKGIFDGNNHSISNFKIKVYNNKNNYSNALGLFCNIEEGTIQYLDLNNVEIMGYDCAGAIAGNAYIGSKIANCNVANANISCIADGAIAGGIVGWAESSDILEENTFSVEDLSTITDEIKLTVANGKTYKVFLTCSNISSTSAVRYFIEYSANILKPSQIGINPVTQDSSTKIYYDTSNIKSINNTNGILSFQLVPNDSNWSGILAPIVFTATGNGNATVKVNIRNVA